MATRTLVSCDWTDPKTSKICGKDVTEEGGTVSFTTENKRLAADLCQEHLMVLRPHAHEASPPIERSNVTRLPRAEPKGRRVTPSPISREDVKDARAWLESNGDLPENSRGRISSVLAEKWLAEGSPRQRADGTFIKSE